MSNIISTDSLFNDQQRHVIAAIADAMISADEAVNLPSASDSAILKTIMAKSEHFADRLVKYIEVFCKEIDPVTATPEALLGALDKNPQFRSFSKILTIIVMQSYYQDPRVLAAHGLAARPPFPLGHEVEAGDWSLLDPVKNRDPIYRPV